MIDKELGISPSKKAERVLKTLMLIQNREGIKAREIAAELKVEVRTVYRYINDLRKMGVRIDSSTGAAGGFLSRGQLYFKSLSFSGLEVTALLLASNVLTKSDGLPLKKDLENAVKKIEKAISYDGREYLRLLKPKISILIDYMKNYYPWEKTFKLLNESMMYQKSVLIDYHSYSAQKKSRREINPYHIFFRDGAWYIIAYCHTRKKIRTFRLDRIQEARLTENPFITPENFDIDGYFENSWRLARGEKVNVKIKFFPPVTRLILESEWHSSQEINILKDGSIIFNVTVEGTWEIKKWILGWGKYALVMEPTALREEIGKEISTMINNYNMQS